MVIFEVLYNLVNNPQKESFTCDCNDGFYGDGFTCAAWNASNECLEETHDCDENAECLDLSGYPENGALTPGYDCRCKDGFKVK